MEIRAVPKKLWGMMIAVAVFFALVCSATVAWYGTGYMCGSLHGSFEMGGLSIGSMGFLMIAILLSYALGKVSPKYRFTASSLALLFAFLGPMADVSDVEPVREMVALMLVGARAPHRYDILPHVPNWWLPKETAVYDDLLAGGVLHWDAWLPTLVLIILANLFWQLSAFFLALIVRKQYVDIEKLPFPLHVAVLYPIRASTTWDGKPELFSWKKSKPFWIGVILGVIWAQDSILAPIAVNIFKFARWPSVTDYIPFYTDLNPTLGSMLPGGAFALTLAWVHIFMSYLMPLDILFSMFITYFVVQIVANVSLVRAGLAPWDPSWGAMTTWMQYGYYVGPMRYAYVGLGMFIATAIVPLIIYRKQVVGSLKLALGRKAEGVSEEGEPLPYRWAWIGLIVTFILFAALMASSGIPMIVTIPLLIFIWLMILGNLRNMAESGYFMIRQYAGFGGVVYPLTSDLLLAAGTPTGPAAFASFQFGQWYCSNPFGLGANVYMTAEKVRTEIGGIRARDVFIAGVLGTVIMVIVMFPMHFWAVQVQGINKAYTAGHLIYNVDMYMRNTRPQVLEGYFARGRPYAQYLIIGFIIGAILYYVRLIYPAIPINPFGVMYGMTSHDTVFMFTPFLIGWIAKMLTLKIGGVKVYEEYGVRIVTGFALMCFLLFLLGQIETTILRQAGII